MVKWLLNTQNVQIYYKYCYISQVQLEQSMVIWYDCGSVIKIIKNTLLSRENERNLIACKDKQLIAVVNVNECDKGE